MGLDNLDAVDLERLDATGLTEELATVGLGEGCLGITRQPSIALTLIMLNKFLGALRAGLLGQIDVFLLLRGQRDA